jgi:repressor LexA
MMQTALTKRQAQVLAFIEDYSDTHDCPPTVREVAHAFRFASPRAAQDHIGALESKGYLRREPGRARNIRLMHDPGGIPLVGRVAAGTPITAFENREGTIDFTSLFGKNDVFAVRVEGASMKDCGIMDGDYVVVRKCPQVENGAIGVAYIDGEATVKRIIKKKGAYELRPENSAYKPIHINADTPDFRIAGPVIGVIRSVT